MKEFNTSAVCIPSIYYMVSTAGKVEQIRKLVDSGKYFAINRARQYGKTTGTPRTSPAFPKICPLRLKTQASSLKSGIKANNTGLLIYNEPNI